MRVYANECRIYRDAGQIVKYMIGRHNRDEVDKSFKAYVTDSLRYLGMGRYIPDAWISYISPKTSPRSRLVAPEDVVSNICERADLVIE